MTVARSRLAAVGRRYAAHGASATPFRWPQLTAVSAAQYYPYFLAGQFHGLVNGMKGASEYEKLLDDTYAGGSGALVGTATSGMDAQSSVHIFIVIAIILANIALFSERRLSPIGRRA